MKFLRGMLGYMIAGMIVMSVWGGFAAPYGIAGGYIAAIIIIGPMWFMNHYVGLIDNADGDAFVDMALGIGITGIARDVFLKGSDAFFSAIPTLGFVILGATIGGYVAVLVEKYMEERALEGKEHFPANEEPAPGYLSEYGGNK